MPLRIQKKQKCVIRLSQVQIRLGIFPLSSKSSKKNFDFVTSLYDFLSLKNDGNVPVFQIRIR
jgi:hypothetical protein